MSNQSFETCASCHSVKYIVFFSRSTNSNKGFQKGSIFFSIASATKHVNTT